MTYRNRIAALLIAALVSPAAFAQTAPAAAQTQKQDDDVVTLSPFTVTTNDDSWTATTTLVGTRTNQELAKVPASVDVITSDFLKDLNLGTLEDAGSFVAGVTVQPRMEARNDDGRVAFRGLTGSATSRNFFTYYVPTDSYNVERIDFSLGSNSLMFGDSAPGGQATVYTKKPRRTKLTELFGSYGSYGTYRYQMDVNVPLTKQFAMRFNAVNRADKSYINNYFWRQRAADIAISYSPFKTTTLTIEGERGKQLRKRADNTLAISDTAAPGLAFNQNNRWYVTSDGNVVQRTSSGLSFNGAAPIPLGNNSTSPSGNQLPLLSGQSETVNMPGGIQKTYYGYSRTLNTWGTTDYLNRPYNVVTVTLTQAIGDLQLELAYNQQYQHQDRNDNSFGTTQTPAVIGVDGNGRPFLDQTGTAQYKVFKNIVKSGRISAAYPVKVGNWMRQYFVLTAQRQKDYGNNRRFFLANAAGTGTLQNNEVTLRAYLDDARMNASPYWDQFKFENLPRTATFQPAIVETYVNTAPFVDIRYNRNISLSASGDYFGGRLNSLLGISWSRVSRKVPGDGKNSTYNNYVFDTRGNITPPGSPDENPGAYAYDPGYDLGARSTMAGLTYRLLNRENITLHVYGVYSQSFNWQSGQTFYGQVLGPILGATHEAGIKADLFKQSLFFTAAVYDIKRQNVAYTWNPDSLSAVQLEDLFNPNNLTPTDPNYFTVVTGILGSERRTVNSNEHSKGVDLTLQAKRWNGLQARGTLSFIHLQSAPDMSVFKALLDAAIARTNSATDPAMKENPTYITNAQTIYDSATITNKVGGIRSAPYTASFVLDYELSKPRGLRLGVTGVLVPNYNVGIYNGVAYTSGARFPLGVYAIYDRRVWGHRTSFRVGAQNVYDLVNGSSDYRKTGTTGFNTAANMPNFIYRYVDPTTYTASVDVKF